MKLGISGTLTKAFIASPLTPLLLLVALALGTMAMLSLPREEEPQISVPLVDILVDANGLKAADAIELVTEPLEDLVKGIDAVEHVYSLSEDDRVIVTARFLVGTDEDLATLRVHEEISANRSRIPIGIPEPLIIGRGINHVPIITLTVTPEPGNVGRWDDNRLHAVADELLHELNKVADTGQSFIVGGRADQVRVEPDPERLSLYGVTLNQLVEKVKSANRSFLIGNIRDNNRTLPVVAGQTLSGVPDVGLLLITSRDGRPVYVKDVADVVVGARPEEHRVWHMEPGENGSIERRPAVTIAIAKRKGTNAPLVAEKILERLEMVKGGLIPPGVAVHVTRDYGATATDKANELLFHLVLATVSIVIIIALFIGWREGGVVLIVIPTTILLTFFAAWLMGYTINRVSLFALIFSIGILVDDAIVVIENIVRHWGMTDERPRLQAAIEAVAEVGNPTIIATLTVVAALLPMMFVSGVMGPYMSPIPANASAAMLISFFVAVMVTPWLVVKFRGTAAGGHADHDHEGAMGRFYRRVAAPLLRTKRRAQMVLLGSVAITVAAKFGDLKELTHIQAYVGTAAPFNFNGLVRHYYLRGKPWEGDLQVNLKPKHARDRQSHAVALEIRERLKDLPVPEGTSVKVVEAPPGPPVLSTLLAEIYGPDTETRRAAAAKVRQAFDGIDFVVDTDDTLGAPAERLRFEVDQENLEFHGVHEEALYNTINVLLSGVSVGYSQRGGGVDPIEIAIRLPKEGLSYSERLLATPVPAPSSNLGDVVRVTREKASHPLFRHNGRFAELVTGELAGRFEAPVYGMFAVNDAVAAMDWGETGPPVIAYHGQPDDERGITLLWDGEWEITYVTFRDMGFAFAFALLAIYLLVVGQFGSFKLPLVILTPVPLTLIGIVPGHWLFGAPFSATSMIGFIALAGIIVRNSILLVEFIRQRQGEGAEICDAILDAGATRFRPIFLTAVAAMVGAAFILTDPIFQGLAISMVFGLASSMAFTLLVIPAIYVWLRA